MPTQRITLKDYRGNAEVWGGHTSPFLLTLRSWKHGTIQVEMMDFHLVQVAEAIAHRLAEKRNDAQRTCATLASRVSSEVAPKENLYA